MALYFAELDSNNTVIRVVTAPEDIVSSPNDPAGETWCSNNIPNDPVIPLVDGAYPGVAWKQTYKTAFDAVTRWNYATVGGTYDPTNDAFTCPQVYASYTLNNEFKWTPPVLIQQWMIKETLYLEIVSMMIIYLLIGMKIY